MRAVVAPRSTPVKKGHHGPLRGVPPRLAVAAGFCVLASWLTYWIVVRAAFKGSASVPMVGGLTMAAARGTTLACWAWLVAQLLVCDAGDEVSGVSFIVRVADRVWMAAVLALATLFFFRLIQIDGAPLLSMAGSIRAASIVFDVLLTTFILAST